MALPDIPSFKPFQIILLAGFGFLALIGLYLFANFGGFNGQGGSVGEVTIWGSLPAPAVESALNELRATSQDFMLVSYREIPLEQFDTAFTEALATGAGPDLILISQEQLMANRAKLSLLPFSVLSERNFIDSFVPIAELFLSSDGIFAMPFAVDPLVLYYNPTLLAQAGVAQPPATWEAVLGTAEALTLRDGGQIIQSAIPLGSYENSTNARAVISLLLLQAGNPLTTVTTSGLSATLADGNATYGATPASAALTFYTQFSDAAKTVYTWNPALPEARSAFIAGDLALYPGFASELPELLAANPNLSIDSAPIPQPQNATVRATYGRVYGIAVARGTDNESGALAVIEALTAESVAVPASTALSMAPVHRTAIAAGGSGRFEPVIFSAALIANGWLSPAPGVVDRIFSTMIRNITSGRSDAGQALQQANQALNTAIAP